MIKFADNKLIYKFDDELLIVEPWGVNSFRVRSFVDQHYIEMENALTEKIYKLTVDYSFNDGSHKLVNGNITVILDHRNRLTFYNKNGEILLKEYIRLRAVKHDDGSEDVGTIEITHDFNSTLKLKSREYTSKVGGGNFRVKQRFESDPNEKIFGMGQYQHSFLDLKNSILELAQRNSQISVPFYISNKNYGFLWNNPGIGKVTFAKNVTEWEMDGTNYIDYWITSGDSPKELIQQYTDVTGRAQEVPSKMLGLWQSKLRYRTPEDVIEVLEGYKQRGIQLSTIAIDYFHWEKQGEYSFDKDFWPDPEKLVQKIKSYYGVEPIISVWPTVQTDAKNYEDFLEGGYLVKVNRGVRLTMQIQGSTVFADMTNPEAGKYIWDRLNDNYKKIGIDYYWIDVAEPGYAVYDFDNVRYHKGTLQEVGNLFPIDYLRIIYDGNVKSNDVVMTLVRGAWAGAQKYGALVWSGDIDCSFEAFNNQVNTGLNMGLAGIPWWTTDIGGFHGGSPNDPAFRELLIRWFQYSTFSPILRMHGDRLPHSKPLSNSGGGSMPTGAPNEIWSYGVEAEVIMTKYIKIRELLKVYLERIYKEASDFGYPIMRTLFFEYPEDKKSWEAENTYLLGAEILVAPIMESEASQREVYLPSNQNWVELFTNRSYTGGQSVIVSTDINQIPVFILENKVDDFKELISYVNENF